MEKHMKIVEIKVDSQANTVIIKAQTFETTNIA